MRPINWPANYRKPLWFYPSTERSPMDVTIYHSTESTPWNKLPKEFCFLFISCLRSSNWQHPFNLIYLITKLPIFSKPNSKTLPHMSCNQFCKVRGTQIFQNHTTVKQHVLLINSGMSLPLSTLEAGPEKGDIWQ